MTDWIDELLTPGDAFGFGGIFDRLSRLGDTLSDPRTYLRIFMVVFGMLLIFGALSYD